MKEVILAQGDVYLLKVSIPATAKLVTTTNVIAKGEATGHAHTAEGDVEIYERNGTMYLRVGSTGGTIQHQEHELVTLTPGDYEIGIVQEYDYFAEEARRVQD